MNGREDKRVIILPRMRNGMIVETERGRERAVRRVVGSVAARRRVVGSVAARRLVAIVAALAVCACASLAVTHAREELADAERAFAADALAHGVRAAFVEHFASDGLVFEPRPVRVRETWPTRPAPADPLAARLSWHPALVEVARAGDLGYSTGPFELVDTRAGRAPVNGAFFSVWQRQTDGRWKVWLDLGGRTPKALDDSAFAQRPRVPLQDRAPEHPTATEVTELDRGLSGLDAAAFAQRLAVDARRHEDGTSPLIGGAWIERLEARPGRTEYTPSEARVSASGDLAASYGTFARRAGDGDDAGKSGHYVHVWLRDKGAWWLAVESVVGDT